MHYHWDFSFLLQQGDDGISYLASIIHGMLLTIFLACLSYLFGLVIGTIAGSCVRMRSRLAHAVGALYLNIFRNIPLIVQLFIWFFVVPDLLPVSVGDYIKQHVSANTITVFCMSLYISSRIGIQVASGIDSIPRNLIQAGRSLGMSTVQIFRYIIYPLAFRTIYPTLISEATNAPKNIAVSYSIGVFELYFQYKQVLERTSQALELIIIITALYFLISMLTIFVMTIIKSAFHLHPWK